MWSSAGLKAALFELKRVLGMPADVALAVRESLEALVQRESAPAQVADTSTVIDRRADVREAAARVEVADAKIERVQADGRFDIGLFANYMRTDAGFPQRAFAPDGGLERVRRLFHYVSAGAMVSLPLLNRNQGEILAARAERAGAAAAYEPARLTADAEIAAAHARDERARQAVNAYSAGAQTLARQNLTVVSESYELGRVTIFDVLSEQRRYLDVERAYTETLKVAYEAPDCAQPGAWRCAMTGDSRVTIHRGATALIAVVLVLAGAGASYLVTRNRADGRTDTSSALTARTAPTSSPPSNRLARRSARCTIARRGGLSDA
jgi:outer membrane protein TolC